MSLIAHAIGAVAVKERAAHTVGAQASVLVVIAKARGNHPGKVVRPVQAGDNISAGVVIAQERRGVRNAKVAAKTRKSTTLGCVTAGRNFDFFIIPG